MEEGNKGNNAADGGDDLEMKDEANQEGRQVGGVGQPETVQSFGSGKTGFIDTIGADGPPEVEMTIKAGSDEEKPVQDDGKAVSMSEKTAEALTTENLSQE